MAEFQGNNTEQPETENAVLQEEQVDQVEQPEQPAQRKERNLAHIIMLSVLAVFLIATIVLVVLLSLPQSELSRPVIDISDSGGKWEDQGAVAVFGDKVRPGSSGEYEFALRNANEYEMSYAFSLSPQYSDGAPQYFPLQFRLKMNNVLIQTEEWRGIDELSFENLYILPNTIQSFTLEWRWAFSAGADENDTLLGASDGTVSMILHLNAQSR